jgi:hypothetical protein
MKRICIFLVLVSQLEAFAQDTEVTASVDSTAIGLNDSLQLTIRVNGRDSTSAEIPYPPRLLGFRRAAGPSVSTQFQWINGRTSNTKSFIYTFLPEKEGDFTVDPVDVSVGGKTYKTQPITIRVTARSTRSLSQSRSSGPFGEGLSLRTGDDVFVATELDRSSAYPGQQITLYYHLYTQIGVTGLQLQESPPLNGFWIEDIAIDSNPTSSRTVINGREYLDYVVKKQALFPNGPGKLKIPSSTFSISVRKDGGDFFGFLGRTETIYRKTKELILDIKPFPAQGRPKDFSDASGAFTLTSSLDKAEASTGDAVTLRVKLAGRGNLKMIPKLAIPPMPDLTLYSSRQVEDLRPNSKDTIEGEKTWEYVLIPKAPGQQKIPPIVFSYFDPEKSAYETIMAPALELRVAPGAEASSVVAGLSGINKQNLMRQGTDIHYIRLSPDDLKLEASRPYQSAWLYVAAGLPVVFNLWAFLYQRERSRTALDAVGARNRRARRVALARLKDAKKAGQIEPRRFYDEAAAALTGYLTDRFNLPEIAMTSDILEKSLTERAVSPATVREIMTSIEECDFARFVSAPAAAEKMKALAARIDKLIDILERT